MASPTPTKPPTSTGNSTIAAIVALSLIGVAGVVYYELRAVAPDTTLVVAIVGLVAPTIVGLVAVVRQNAENENKRLDEARQDRETAANERAVLAQRISETTQTAKAAVDHVESLSVQVDGRLTQLLEAVATQRYAEGQLAGPGPVLTPPSMALAPVVTVAVRAPSMEYVSDGPLIPPALLEPITSEGPPTLETQPLKIPPEGKPT